MWLHSWAREWHNLCSLNKFRPTVLIYKVCFQKLTLLLLDMKTKVEVNFWNNEGH